MRIQFSRFIGPVLLLSALPLAWADSWPGPRVVNVFSGNGQYFVRILPGKSVGDTFGFADAAKGPYARAEFYARQPDRSYQLAADVSLKNPVAPIDVIVSNQVICAFDNWHNLGYGKVVAIYDRKGMNVGDTFGFADAAKGPYARAEFYARQPDRSYQLAADVSLKNPVAPIDVIVSNQGDLLTFDNWHNLGYGKVVAI